MLTTFRSVLRHPLHLDISGALSLCPSQVGFGLVGRNGGGVGSVPVVSLLLVEERLQLSGDVFGDGLFGILLHAAVDGGVYLESVGVDVVRTSLAVQVLVAPSVDGVLLPRERILVELLLLPGGVVASHGLLSHEHLAQIVAQVGAVPFLMTDAMEVKSERSLPQFFTLFRGEEAGFLHLHQYRVATVDASLGLTHRVVVARVLAHAYEQGTLASVERSRFLAEIRLRGGLYADRIVEEVKVVKVHADNLLLRVETLQLEGNHPFDGLLQQSFHRRGSFLGIKLLGKLLRDGASAACALLPEQSALHDGTQQGLKVDAVVIVESDVLSSEKCFDEGRREFVKVGEYTVGTDIAPCAQLFSVGREDFSGKLVNRVLQLLYVGHVADSSSEDTEEDDADGKNTQYVTCPQDTEKLLPHTNKVLRLQRYDI